MKAIKKFIYILCAASLGLMTACAPDDDHELGSYNISPDQISFNITPGADEWTYDYAVTFEGVNMVHSCEVSFGDGTTTRNLTGSYTYIAAAGTYDVKCTVSIPDGTLITKETTVTILNDHPDYDANPNNLWNGVEYTNTHYYAPGWTQITGGPGFSAAGKNYTLTFPQATTDQWQNQFGFVTTTVSTTGRDWYKLTLQNGTGEKAPLFLLPGNHDISNAVGHPRIPKKNIDASSSASIFNTMLNPTRVVDKDSYMRDANLCNYSFEKSGIHFSFIDMWPDERNRQWLSTDLSGLPDGGVCLIFTHDQPDIETKHLINPNGKHDVNAHDKFENLVADTSSVASVDETALEEHRELAQFVKNHPAIKAYFHGNENYNEYYTWRGADGDIALPAFRVDSPMKGVKSADDEGLLSFQLVVIDTLEKRMTVRECRWNAPRRGLSWGETITIRL